MISAEDGSGRAIVVQDLVKRFGDFTAVGGIDFEVYPGEIFGFLGPNGSGKTTTIRMMLGLLPPTRGSAHVLGIPVMERAAAIRSRVGYMSQHFSLYNDLTVQQNLRFYGAAYGLSGGRLSESLADALEMAGLVGREKVKTAELSGGWRQRLALSAAILHQPQVLFLDEPTAGVDPISRREFWELLYRLIERGVTVFVTTHYMDEAEHCHRLAFLQRGRIIAMGTPERLRETMMEGHVIEISSVDTIRAVRELQRIAGRGELHLSQVEVYGAAVHAVIHDAEQPVEALRRSLMETGVSPGSVREIEPSLEDVFIACMR